MSESNGSATYAPNVIVALLRVMADLPAIGKDQRMSGSGAGGYAYRGIEQITGHCQGLFAKHGVVFAPRLVSHEIREIEVNGKPWTDTIEQVEYDVYGPAGIEDRITVGPILAIGRDNSDKGANKCLTQAYKYALLQALCISDAKDDGDTQTHEADRRYQEPASPQPISPANVERIVSTCTSEGVDVAAVVRHATEGRTNDPAELLTSEVAAARAALDALKASPNPSGGDEATMPMPANALAGAQVGNDGEEGSSLSVPSDGAPSEPSKEQARKRFFAVVGELWGDLPVAERDATRKRWLKATFGVDSASALSAGQLRQAADLLAAEIAQPTLLDEPVEAEIVDTGSV